MQDTELIASIKNIVESNKGDVRCFDEDFMANDIAGGNIDDAWQGGFNDGCSYVANELAELIEDYEKDANEN